jgi:hypothetical protein
MSIAFAPLRSFSYEEDMSAAKAPAQIFSATTNHLTWCLRDLNLLDHVRFFCLPEHVAPNNRTEAAFLRWTLGLDVLLWGSYLPGSTTTMWLNIQESIPRGGRKEKREEPGRQCEELFPIMFRTRHSMMTVSQSEPLHAYVLLFVSLLQALQARQDRDGRFKSALFSSSPWDELRSSTTECAELAEILVSDVFPLATTRSCAHDDGSLSPCRVLAEVVGGWIGHKLYEGQSDGPSGDYLEINKRRLCNVMKRCIQLEASIPENYYRYGALLSMLRERREAVSTFLQAKTWEDARPAGNPYLLEAIADMALEAIPGAFAEVPLALYAAHAARAINVGGDRTKKALRKTLEESTIYQIQREPVGKGEGDDSAGQADGPWAIVECLFSDEYQPE